MEGPSLFLAEEQLQPFVGRVITGVRGNTNLPKESFRGKKVEHIFSWGKHLVFQFDDRALRVHFLLFGTFTADVEGTSITGDYKKARTPRLAFDFENGNIEMYNCSLKVTETDDLRRTYDFTRSIMSPAWDEEQALRLVLSHPNEEIGDVLLDQDIFAGVGNIIKNEILSRTLLNPREHIQDIEESTLRTLIAETRAYSFQFYEWRKEFMLRKNLKIHRKKTCPHCGGNVTHEKTGKKMRLSHYCPTCQALKGAT